MRDDDRDDPFDEFFDEIERMMNEMMGPNANVHFEHNSERGRDRDQGGHDIHFDIHEHDDEIRVVADIPGVEKDAIDLQCDGKTLHLEAGGGERRYDERVSLPSRVDEHSASATYNNGVLEVVFDRVDDSTSIDV
ncbi:Hsp20/alpha crystallin family protein [Halovenus sp. HT40]|uniref:Hsp20/alpha crystallin family protein n=1 Tax=Halovenus sp. HT40 TaxID=3126691 RepID=UPI00300E9ACC